MAVILYHNSLQVDGTLSENQDGLCPYEVMVYIGIRGARILHVEGTEIIAYKNNVKVLDI
jgi:hypothetical protein